MQMFNTTTTEALFIKNILKNTYLPILPTISEGEYMIQGTHYIHRNRILKCLESGLFLYDSEYDEGKPYSNCPVELTLKCSDLILCSNTTLCCRGKPEAKFTIEGLFEHRKHVPGTTSNFVSNSDTYDIDTHIHLGNYLRWYRATKGIDLMSLYNHFTGEETQLFHIEDGHFISKPSSKYTTWIVKVQLNKEYTIYIDSSSPVFVGGTFLNHFGRIKYQNASDKKFIDEIMVDNIKTYYHTSYGQPIHYSAFTDNPDLFAYNNNFYLVIQTCNLHNSSIVVLEGNHKKSPNRIVTSAESLNNLDFKVDYKQFKPIMSPSLSLVPTTHVIPYAPRLIEFLTENAITSEEEIPHNIGRIQKQLGIYDKEDIPKDIWDDRLRFLIYHNYNKYTSDYYFNTSFPKTQEIVSKNFPKTLDGKIICGVYDENNNLIGLKNIKTKRESDTIYDITGYVDKDVENKLFKYRGV